MMTAPAALASPASLLVEPLPFLCDASVKYAACTPLTLPVENQADWIDEQVGGWSEAATYHWDSVVHLQMNGIARRVQPNPVLWTVACAWLGRALPDTLHGPAVITGPACDDSDLYRQLTEQMAAQTHKALEAATAWWLEHDYCLPLWPSYPADPVYAKAIAQTRAAL